jgi:hypothetical protein
VKKIRHKLYAYLSGGLLLSQIMMGVTYYSGPGVTSETPEVMSQNIITASNKERTNENINIVTESAKLNEAAKLKLDDMFTNNYWEHRSPSGVQAWDFIKKINYNYALAGENLAKGYHDSGSTVKAWMASPEHKENILNTGYTETGVAVGSGELNGKPVTLAVQLFATPVAGTVSAGTKTEASVLGAQKSTDFSLFNPVMTARIPYFIAWLVLFVLIVFDGIELRRLGLHKSKKHMFEFRSALLINLVAFIVLFVSFAAVL